MDRNGYDVDLAMYVGRAWIGLEGHDAVKVQSPADGHTIGRLPIASTGDLDRALESADEAFRRWRAETPQTRASVLAKAAALVRSRADRLATIATIEQGKPKAEARGEALAAADLLDFHAGEALRIYGRVLPRSSSAQALVLKQPVGPVAAFCAWNFPILNVVRKISPALAAGCSVILKPSEETPGSAVEMMRCLIDAGLPSGVAQLVFGRPDHISRYLLASPVTRKLSFTGSVAVGKHLAGLAAETLMKTTMELGGHAPVLVFDDCDVDRTIEALVTHKFRNAGQVCVAPTRFHIQEGIYDRFVAGFTERTRALNVGNGLEADVHMGPLANPRRPEAISAMVEDATAKGARLLTGGHEGARGGLFYEPTVLGDVPLSARGMNEEPFGPVAMMHRFAKVDEAIAEANRLPFGLAAYCFTENGRRQRQLGTEIEAGMVAINMTRLSWPDAPFGGIKDSGQGSEDGPEGIDQHLIIKSVHIV